MLGIFVKKMIFLVRLNGNGLKMNFIVSMMRFSLLLLAVGFRFCQLPKLYRKNGISKVNRDYCNL